MSLHQEPDGESLKAGYELTDANIPDIAGFLVVMAASIAVVFVLAFGIGKLIYYGLNKQDGAANKWSQMAGIKRAIWNLILKSNSSSCSRWSRDFRRHGCKPTTEIWTSPKCTPARTCC